MENVHQTVFPHEFVRENAETFLDVVFRLSLPPHTAKIGNRIDFEFVFSNLIHELGKRHRIPGKKLPGPLHIFLDVCQNGFTIVLGYVFRIVLHLRPP